MPGVIRALALLAILLLVPCVAATESPAATPVASGDPTGRQDLLKPVDTSSPSATYQSFVTGSHDLADAYQRYLSHKTFAKAEGLIQAIDRLRRLLDLDPLPPAIRFKAGGAAFGYLKDILDRLPEVPPTDIPGAPGRDWGKLPDKWRLPGTNIVIAKVESGPRAGEYLFTADTVERLPAFHKLIISEPPLQPTRFLNWHQEQVNFTGPFIPDALLRQLPDALKRTVLDTPIWKVALTVLILLMVFLLAWGWSRLARRLGRHAGRATRLGWRLSVPLVFLALYLAATVFIHSQINLSGTFALGNLLFSAVLLYGSAAWAAWVAWYFLAELIIASPRFPDKSYDAHLLRLAARLGSTLSAAALLVYGANAVGIPALGLVAGLGIGGLAFALASKPSLENLFGGLALFADRPFRIGDFIHYSANAQGGWIESIGSRSCRIRALDGTLITVPNGDLATMHITNVTARTKHLFLHRIGVRYETSRAQIEWLVAAIRDTMAAHPMVEKAPGFPRVILVGFGDFAITIEARAYVLTASLAEFMDVQQQLLLAILRKVEEAGTGFAFPSQTAYLARDMGIDIATKDRIDAAAEAGQRPDNVSAAPPEPMR